MKRSLVLGVAAGACLTLALAGCSSSKPAAAASSSSVAASSSSAASSAPAAVAPASSAGSSAASSAPASSAPASSAPASSAPVSSGSASASVVAPTKAKKNYKISFIQGVAGDNFYITMQCGIQTEAAKLGVTVNTQGATAFDPTLQIPILSSVVSSKPDAILIAPTDVKALQAPLAKAAAAGIKIVLVDTTVNDPSFAASQVSSDNVGGGKAAFTAIKGLSPKGGKVLVISVNPGISTTDARVKGFQDATAADSSFTYLGVQYSHNDPATAAQLVTAALRKDPDITGIFATNLFAAEGAATGIKQAGKAGKVSIVGFDAGPDQIKALKDGTVQALVAQQPDTIGTDGLDQAIASLDGGTVTPKIQTGFSIITKANADTTTAAYKAAC
jgi:ribose transport system substrate-binding protein